MEEKKADWGEVARSVRFKDLALRKKKFLFGWWIVSTAFYIIFLVGAGLAQKFYSLRVIGDINVGYLLVLIMMIYCFLISVYYAYWANKVSDKITTDLVEEFKEGGLYK